MNRIASRLLVGLCLALAFRPTCDAGLIQLSPSADARLVMVYGSGADGATIHLSTYDLSGNTQRSVIRFDLSAIPAGDAVDSAVLTLYVQPAPYNVNPGLAMEVYRVTQPWTETGVSWTTSGISPWTPGGDYAGTGATGTSPYAVNSAVNPPSLSPLTWDITGLVQEWHGGVQPNHGLLLDSAPGNGLLFYSREIRSRTDLARYAPLLTVSYSPIPEVAPPWAGLLACLPWLGRRWWRRNRR